MENFYKENDKLEHTESAQENVTENEPGESRDENESTDNMELLNENSEANEPISEENEPDIHEEVPPVLASLNENFRDELDHVHPQNNAQEEHFHQMEPEAIKEEEITAAHDENTHENIEAQETNTSEPEPASEQELRETAQTEETVSEPIHLNIVGEVPVEDLHDASAEEGSNEEETSSEHTSEVDDELEGKTKNELLKIVEEAIHFPESRKINLKVQHARTEFFKILEDERKDAKDKFTADETNEGKEYIAPHDPLVKDFNQAFKLFKTRRKEYIDDLNRQKELNLQLKKEILEKLKELIESAETQSSFTEIKKLQEEWKKIGQVPIAEAENLWTAYSFYVNKFYDQFSLYSEFKDLDRKRNFTAKEDIIASIEKLYFLDDMNDALRQLRMLQDDWRHIGPVPKDNLEDIIERYKNAVVKIYEKKERQNEEHRKRREQNLEAKTEILAKMMEIVEFQSDKVQEWMDKNVEMGGWIEKWRGIGSVPLDKRDVLKEQFSDAIKKFNKHKNDFFRDRKKEKVDNLKKKTELCDKAETILAADDFAAHKKEILRLQDEWKKIGPVPPKFSDSIWKRFHTACDSFFKRMSEAYSVRDKEQQDNLEKKNAIIEKIENLSKEASIEDLEETVGAIREEWESIGFVPFKQKEEVNKKYYKALGLLANKSKGGRGRFSRGNEMVSYKLMLESWTHDNGGDKRIDSERHRLQRDLKKLENEVLTLENNMQFLSNSKTADALKGNLENQIGKLRVKMQEIEEKIRITRQINTAA